MRRAVDRPCRRQRTGAGVAAARHDHAADTVTRLVAVAGEAWLAPGRRAAAQIAARAAAIAGAPIAVRARRRRPRAPAAPRHRQRRESRARLTAGDADAPAEPAWRPEGYRMGRWARLTLTVTVLAAAVVIAVSLRGPPRRRRWLTSRSPRVTRCGRSPRRLPPTRPAGRHRRDRELNDAPSGRAAGRGRAAGAGSRLTAADRRGDLAPRRQISAARHAVGACMPVDAIYRQPLHLGLTRV